MSAEDIHQHHLHKKIIVTGGAGFIGSNLIKGLNDLGYQNIVVVDNLSRAEKFKNLRDLVIADYIDKHDFLKMMQTENEKPLVLENVCAIFHQGACSDTMEHNGEYMMRNNFAYSKTVFLQAIHHHIPFIYASSAAVYGDLQGFQESFIHEKPLNVYGYSKLLFDRYVQQFLANLNYKNNVVGLRYFNVYGPREFHKGKMASVAMHHFMQFKNTQKVKLFGEYGGYGAGAHLRDFIYVKDVVAVNLFFLAQTLENQRTKIIQDVFNLGTGKAESFNQIAHAVLNAGLNSTSTSILPLNHFIENKQLEYIDFPESLKGKYQCYTQANIQKLRDIGYQEKFHDVFTGVQDYYQWLAEHHADFMD